MSGRRHCDFGDPPNGLGADTGSGQTPSVVKRKPPEDESTRMTAFDFRGARYAVVSWSPRAEACARLTPAERAVAQLIVAGRSNEEIARVRSTSVNTVSNQVSALLRKVGVGSRFELIAALGR